MKRSSTRLVIASLDEAERQLPTLVKFRLSQTAFISQPMRSVTTGHHVASLGVTRPRLIQDPKTQEASLTFHRYLNVGTVEVEKKPAGYEVRFPKREDLFKNVARAEEAVLLRAEEAFLQSAEAMLARSSIIQNALNPVKEILSYLREESMAPVAHFRPQQKYVTFLEGLQYVTLRDGTVHPGPVLLAFWERQAPIEVMLGDILRQGYPHLAGPLRIRQMVPYVRAANAYFWPSHQAGRRLEYRLADFKAYLGRLYHGYTQSQVKLNNHIADLTDIGVFERDGKFRIASVGVWDRFEERAPSFG